MKFRYTKIFLIMSCFVSSVFGEESSVNLSQAQVIANKVVQAKNGRIICTANLRCSTILTGQFYANRNYSPVWIDGSGNISQNAVQVTKILHEAYRDGLNPFDYHTKELRNLVTQIEANKAAGNVPSNLLADYDLTLTDAYLLYSRHLELGRVDPVSAYPDWNVDRRNANVLIQFQNAIKNNAVVANLSDIAPKNEYYLKLRDKLAIYMQSAVDGGWKTIPAGSDLRIGMHGSRVELLEKRLAATEGYVLSDNIGQYTKEVKDTVARFQTNMGLKSTGVVDKATLQALNVPVSQRIKQIEMNMDRLRWLPTNLSSRYIWVNIPAYSLGIYDHGKNQLTMPVIVGGGGENKTCVVNSAITNIEVNPYWGIPKRIATKEYLKKIQADPEYLSKHDIRVFNSSDKQEVDPSTVDWENINPNNFNYFLKQDPGKKNALGKLKFIFNNACGIYLHDTSNPALFAKMSRSLSHGCVRVSDPIGLGDYLVTNNSTSWNNQKLASAIKSGDHSWVKLTEPMDIHVVYQTAWVNNDNLMFRKDIYGIESIDFPIYIPYKIPAESN